MPRFPRSHASVLVNLDSSEMNYMSAMRNSTAVTSARVVTGSTMMLTTNGGLRATQGRIPVESARQTVTL